MSRVCLTDSHRHCPRHPSVPGSSFPGPSHDCSLTIGEGSLSSDLSRLVGKMRVEVLTQRGLWIETVCVKCSAHSQYERGQGLRSLLFPAPLWLSIVPWQEMALGCHSCVFRKKCSRVALDPAGAPQSGLCPFSLLRAGPAQPRRAVPSLHMEHLVPEVPVMLSTLS